MLGLLTAGIFQTARAAGERPQPAQVTDPAPPRGSAASPSPARTLDPAPRAFIKLGKLKAPTGPRLALAIAVGLMAVAEIAVVGLLIFYTPTTKKVPR